MKINKKSITNLLIQNGYKQIGTKYRKNHKSIYITNYRVFVCLNGGGVAGFHYKINNFIEKLNCILDERLIIDVQDNYWQMNNVKIYPEEVKFIENTKQYDLPEFFKKFQTFHAVAPIQTLRQKSDFTMLCTDGSVHYAKWHCAYK